MKVGLIIEGTPDVDVYVHLAKQINSEIKFVTMPLGKKPSLIRQCGEKASILLNKFDCSYVFIMWDLEPAQFEDVSKDDKKKRGCRYEDKRNIFKRLDEAKVDRSKVILICIENMLETWFLYDEQALIDVLSKKTHPIKKLERKTDVKTRDPKSYLIDLYNRYRGSKYNDTQDAIQIAKRIRLNKLRKCETFVRFELKILGLNSDK